MEADIYKRLLERLRGMKAVAVGFSGGADSTLLLAAAKEVLGDRVLALTAVTPYMERQEAADTLALSAELGVHHRLVELDMPEGLEANPPERCYLCKRALYAKLMEVAREAGFERVLDGSNLDDLGDFRPGLRALRELEIESPLLACRISKADVRRLSEYLGLPTWNKPTNACLLTRLPVGRRVTMADLQRVEEAERFLRALGYSWVRVRLHADLARIEVAPEQRLQLLEEAEKISGTLRELGFRYITLDLMGYRLGSMNPDCPGDDLGNGDDASDGTGDHSSDTVGEVASYRPLPGMKIGLL